jgi:hypothetical protein
MTTTSLFKNTTARPSAHSTDRSSEPSASARRLAPLAISPYGSPEQMPTVEFEVAFRRRLADLSDGSERSTERPRRAAVTALLTAIRGGITVDRLLSIAAGLSAGELVDAYDFVDRLRCDASAALDQLFDDPTIECFDEVAPAIAGLLPQAVSYLRRTAAATPDGFTSAVRHFEAQTHDLDDAIDEIEHRLRSGDDAVWELLGQRDDGHQGGIYNDPCYRPRRLGDITSVRLASLLSESPEDDRR